MKENQSQTNTEQTQRPRVVVVGGGFGGLSVARNLADSEMDVLVLDKHNYHGFWPLLYQVATAGLEPEAIAYPVRAILRKHQNVSFQMQEVCQVDFEARQVQTKSGLSLDYDYLVLAAGSANNYFGNDKLGNYTFGLKDINDAIQLRNQLLSCFELAARERDPQKQAALMTFVIVGGGPTGVELAGAFSELIRHVVRKDYPTLDLSLAQVLLVEATDKILMSFPAGLQRKAIRKLEKMGVKLKLNAAVENVEADRVIFKDGSQIETCTVVWAAGVRSSTLADKLDQELARGFRVPVKPTLNLASQPEVFVIGDMSYLETYKPKTAYPMVAPVAIQQGEQAAKNILALHKGQSAQPFKYFDKGSMATIGRRAAILDAFGIKLSGFPAWVAWLAIHLISLIGFRNRMIVLTNWAYNYFTYDRGARVITNEVRRNEVQVG